MLLIEPIAFDICNEQTIFNGLFYYGKLDIAGSSSIGNPFLFSVFFEAVFDGGALTIESVWVNFIYYTLNLCSRKTCSRDWS